MNNKIIGDGYSGHGPGLNNPDLQDTPDIGPIPVGIWDISLWSLIAYEDKGPIVAHLDPTVRGQTRGRSGFLIHGDNKSQDYSASHGCIIASYSIRKQIFQSNTKDLTVKAYQ